MVTYPIRLGRFFFSCLGKIKGKVEEEKIVKVDCLSPDYVLLYYVKRMHVEGDIRDC